MKEYLKILSSILIALLTLATFVSVISGISALASGSDNISEDIFLPFLFALAGFILFGITGSLFWLLFFKKLGNLSVSLMSKHVISASMSVVASVLVLGLVFFRGGLQELSQVAIFLIPVVVVVIFSLACYWLLFQHKIK